MEHSSISSSPSPSSSDYSEWISGILHLPKCTSLRARMLGRSVGRLPMRYRGFQKDDVEVGWFSTRIIPDLLKEQRIECFDNSHVLWLSNYDSIILQEYISEDSQPTFDESTHLWKGDFTVRLGEYLLVQSMRSKLEALTLSLIFKKVWWKFKSKWTCMKEHGWDAVTSSSGVGNKLSISWYFSPTCEGGKVMNKCLRYDAGDSGADYQYWYAH